MAASAAGTASRSRTTRKIDSCGFVFPCAPDAIAASTSSLEHGQRVLVQLEVLRVLPSLRHLDRAVVRTVGVTAHPADDPLGERDPDLLVVAEVRMLVEPLHGLRAGIPVERGIGSKTMYL